MLRPPGRCRAEAFYSRRMPPARQRCRRLRRIGASVYENKKRCERSALVHRSLLERMILGNGTKLAVKPRHSKYSIFLLQRAWAQWAQALPKRGPRAHGPILASSGEISLFMRFRAASLELPVQSHFAARERVSNAGVLPLRACSLCGRAPFAGVLLLRARAYSLCGRQECVGGSHRHATDKID